MYLLFTMSLAENSTIIVSSNIEMSIWILGAFRAFGVLRVVSKVVQAILAISTLEIILNSFGGNNY